MVNTIYKENHLSKKCHCHNAHQGISEKQGRIKQLGDNLLQERSQKCREATSTVPIYIDLDTDTGNNTQVNFLGRGRAKVGAGARVEAKIGVGSEARAKDVEADPNSYKKYG